MCRKDQSVDDFALALRAIGEPLHGRRAADISMAKVLGQLFATTELFEMQTRPELMLLQKSMVLVEGVARALDPDLDIWTVSEPVVGDWVRREAGPLGRLEELKEHFDTAVDQPRPPPGHRRQGRGRARRLRPRQARSRPALLPLHVVSGFWLAAILGCGDDLAPASV